MKASKPLLFSLCAPFTLSGLSLAAELSAIDADVAVVDFSGQTFTGPQPFTTTTNNWARADDFSGANFSGLTIGIGSGSNNANQPFLDAKVANADFSGVTFDWAPYVHQSNGLRVNIFRQQEPSGTQYSGATFADSVWNITLNSTSFDAASSVALFNDGSGATDAATATSAVDFTGADFNFTGVGAATLANEIATIFVTNLGGFDGETPIGAFFDAEFVNNNFAEFDYATAAGLQIDLSAAGWQLVGPGVPLPATIYWTGTGGATWDQSTTANFSTNFEASPLAVTDFDSATATSGKAVFADEYFDSGSKPVTVSNITVAAGGVDVDTIEFTNDEVTYTVNSSDANGIKTATLISFTGGGITNFTGTHAHTGDTNVVDGYLTLEDGGRVSFAPTANGTTNRIHGDPDAGFVDLNGEIFFDLSGADISAGNRWTPIDVSTLNELYGSTFSVNSSLGAFAESLEDPNVWTLSNGNEIWTFSESTGTLVLSFITYDIGTPTTSPFDQSANSLSNTGNLATWNFATGYNPNIDASDFSGIDFTSLNELTAIDFSASSLTGAGIGNFSGSNFSGLTLDLGNQNNAFRGDDFTGADFSGSTINVGTGGGGNQPFLFATIVDADFSGVTFNWIPSSNGDGDHRINMFRHDPVTGTAYTGATFADSVWNINLTGTSLVAGAANLAFFNDGSGASDAANAANAVDFTGADFNFSGTVALGSDVGNLLITNLGGFDGPTAIGAFYDQAFVDNNSADFGHSGSSLVAALNAAGWQPVGPIVVTSPFDSWAAANGLDGSPGKESGPSDDPDGDGSNLYEYFFWNSDPLVAEAFGSELRGVDASGAVTGDLVFSHDRPVDISELTVTYQWSTDLVTFYNSGESDGTSTVSFATGDTGTPANGHTPEYESVEVTASVTSGPVPAKLFVRVSVTLP
ncbi:beta strand repeat-containing protein [Haloferula chungangensis]|uniref:Beta strand repeat-containing protein n=1 Tax=Haloferula chungangensis TaxID=1048331 RepID=A0ABW2LB62_9BACT